MSTTAEPTTPAAAAPAAQRRPAPRHSFGPLLLRLHFYAGLFVAPFLLVAAVTGLLYTFTPQLEKAVHADELVVAGPGGTVRPLAEQVAAARASHPEGALLSVRPGGGDATTQVDFGSPELDFEHQHTVYVNPYTAEINGQLTTWFATTPMKTWFDDLHRNLHLGPVGRHYSEFAASWLWIIALGGVALWWRRQRGRRMLRPDLSARKGVRRTRSWHAATGLWLLIGMLLLSATGLTWSRYAGGNFADALDAIKGSRPAVSTDLSGAPAGPAGGGHHTTPAGGGESSASADAAAIDGVLTAARAQGLGGPVTIVVPENNVTAWTVTQEDALWPVGRDSVAVDPGTGTITDRSDFADWPLMAKLTQWGIYAHMGNLFGVANQILLAALAIGLICVIVWGYRMWWQRRPTRDGTRALAGAAPVGPGAWQQLPAWGIVVGVPVVLALGWFLPLFGLPLAAFLAADLLIGALRRRRAARVPVSPAPAGR